MTEETKEPKDELLAALIVCVFGDKAVKIPFVSQQLPVVNPEWLAHTFFKLISLCKEAMLEGKTEEEREAILLKWQGIAEQVEKQQQKPSIFTGGVNGSRFSGLGGRP